VTAAPSATAVPVQPAGGASAGVSGEAVAGGVVLVVLLIYGGFYWRGATALDRYSDGFVIEQCPVCGSGHPVVDHRSDRLLGIPRPRRIVRCDTCRSLLRETGTRRWRYAVDPLKNADLYRELNGMEVDEDQLRALQMGTKASSAVHTPVQPPAFLDDQNE